MVKLPSFKQLSEGLNKTFLRFPFAIVYAIIGSFTAIYLVDFKNNDDDIQQILIKVIMSSALGVLSATAITLYTERLKKGTKAYIIGSIFKIITPIAYYFTLPNYLNNRCGIRYVLIMLALHLLVSYAPFVSKGNINGFWQFNKSLFINFLISILYSCVLYLGLIAAIATVDELFNVNIDGDIYLKLYIFMAGIFNTIFFLAGVPEYFSELDNETDYPKGLKIFTQFVLLPLVFIYLLILYSYEVKIIFTQTMPNGIVSYLVLGFAIFGILALLLVYPIQNNIGNQWIKRFSTSFYIALFPLIGLLFWAIGLRVFQYGFTEKRYFLLALAIWLAFVSLYYLLNKSKNIKIIPISLSILTVLSIYGPWSTFQVSLYSQQSILKDLLIKSNLIDGDKINKNKSTVTKENEKQIGEIVDYICKNHGIEGLRYIIGSKTDSMANIKPENSYDQTSYVLKQFGLKHPSSSYSEIKYFTYTAPQANIVTEQYESIVRISSNDYISEYQLAINGQLYKLNFNNENGTLKLKKADKILASLDIWPLLLKISQENKNQLTKNVYQIINIENNVKYKVVIQKSSGYINSETNRLENSNYELYLLLILSNP